MRLDSFVELKQDIYQTLKTMRVDSVFVYIDKMIMIY